MKTFRAGTYVNQGHYKSFQPTQLDRQWMMDDMELLRLLSVADREMGRLDMYSEHVPNIDLYISMLVAKEATQSSKIEGTKTNVTEVFLNREHVDSEKRDDVEEVRNYIMAMGHAIEKLGEIPFSSRLIRSAHRILLQSGRGGRKLPGEFRNSQNWIGGTSINSALFVPPVHTSVPELMGDLEKFAHNDAHFFPCLLKTALLHYQFETIHPFLDGNGRVGRLMVTLYLVDRGVLKKPILYLSDFFERNRTLYYDNLMRARTHHDIKRWFVFFLQGVIETAKNGVATFDAILKLKKQKEKLIRQSHRGPKLLKLLEKLFVHPITDAYDVAAVTGVSMPTAYKVIGEMERYGILKKTTNGRRFQFFTFAPYLDLFSTEP